MPVNLEYSSLHYLKQWFQSERHLHAALNSDDNGVIQGGISDSVSFFVVARNLPTKYDVGKGKQRYEPLANAYLSIKDVKVSESNYIEVLNQFQAEVAERYGGKRLISLASKLLWLRFQDPFIIYDSQVRSAIKVPPGDYAYFTKKWLEEYQKHQHKIAKVSSNLPLVSRYIDFNLYDPSVTEITQVANASWFHKRVFDIYLGHL